MFRSTSDYVCFAKSVAVFFVVGASMTNPMTTALKVQSSAAYGFHGPVSDFSLSMSSMSNISNKHYLYSNNSDFSTVFGAKVNASRLAGLLLLVFRLVL